MQTRKIQNSIFNRILLSSDCTIPDEKDSFAVQTLLFKIFNFKLGKNLLDDLNINDSFALIFDSNNEIISHQQSFEY